MALKALRYYKLSHIINTVIVERFTQTVVAMLDHNSCHNQEPSLSQFHLARKLCLYYRKTGNSSKKGCRFLELSYFLLYYFLEQLDSNMFRLKL